VAQIVFTADEEGAQPRPSLKVEVVASEPVLGCGEVARDVGGGEIRRQVVVGRSLPGEEPLELAALQRWRRRGGPKQSSAAAWREERSLNREAGPPLRSGPSGAQPAMDQREVGGAHGPKGRPSARVGRQIGLVSRRRNGRLAKRVAFLGGSPGANSTVNRRIILRETAHAITVYYDNLIRCHL
jgi:hypothetical protein